MKLGFLGGGRSTKMKHRLLTRHDKMKERTEIKRKNRSFTQMEEAIHFGEKTQQFQRKASDATEITLQICEKINFGGRNFERLRCFRGVESWF